MPNNKAKYVLLAYEYHTVFYQTNKIKLVIVNSAISLQLWYDRMSSRRTSVRGYSMRSASVR